jgi:hypothetical protein
LEKSKAKVKELTESALELMKPYYDNAEFFNTLAIDLQNRVE